MSLNNPHNLLAKVENIQAITKNNVKNVRKSAKKDKHKKFIFRLKYDEI